MSSQTASHLLNDPETTAEQCIYVGRQPIFNLALEVTGYELLFRSGPTGAANVTDGDLATRQTVDRTLSVIGLDGLVGEKAAYINMTRDLLVEEFYQILPARQCVVELLEDVEIDGEVIDACAKLREAGYGLALDDFVFGEEYEPLLKMADVVKIDLMQTSLEQAEQLIQEYQRPGLTFLAEKVERQDEFAEARGAGFRAFQGYFFCRPANVPGREVSATRANCLRFCQQALTSPMDFDALEAIVKQEVALSVRLLRYLNSAGIGLRYHITSIRQAFTLLGEQPLRRWAILTAAVCLGDGKPNELVRVCLTRARFCEKVQPLLPAEHKQVDLFLYGLLTAMDALLDQPMSEVVRRLPVSGALKATLLGEATSLGKLHTLMIACERGDYNTVNLLSRWLQGDPQQILQTHQEAVAWADQTLSELEAH